VVGTGYSRVLVSDLTKRYGLLEALAGVSFRIEGGQIVALLGPNGSGKTTTFKCMLGVIDFDGSVEISGMPVKSRGKEARRLIGYLPQTPAFDAGDTVERVLQFLAELKGAQRSRVGLLLERVQLVNERQMKVGEISGGMRQRLALAAALLSDPPVLLLDEPTANLDIESRAQFRALLGDLRDEGKTILLSTHFSESIHGLADRYIMLKQGRKVMDLGADELSPVKGTRAVVDLNGTAPSAFLSALKEIGVGPERINMLGTNPADALAHALTSGDEDEETPR
jgi:ABC-type multidrug transport system ATPase subunit